MRRWPLLLLSAVAACGGDGRCPLIGCVSQLTVQLPAGISSARACVGDVCSTEVSGGVLVVPLSRLGEGGAVDVTVELVAAGGAASTVAGTVPVQITRPNGDSCPPVCVNGTARVDAETQQLVPVRTG